MFEPSKTTISFKDAVNASYRNQAVSVFDMYRGMKSVPGVTSKKVHDANFAFYSTELAKLHQSLYEPLYNVTYTRDIDIDVGGGFVDYVQYQTVNWAGMTAELQNLFGNNGNVIPRINAALSKEQVLVFTFELAYDLSFVELEKLDTIKLRKSLTDIYNNVAVAGFDLFCEKIVYEGVNGGVSLFSHPKVPVMTIDNSSASAANAGFAGMTDADIVAFFNGIFQYFLSNSNMNMRIIPDRILVPTFVGADWSSRMSALYTKNLRKYLTENNLAVDEANDPNFTVVIESRPALNAAGVGHHGRIIAYKKNKSFERIDMPYPMQAYMTLPDIGRMCYTTAFLGQVSEVQLPYSSSDKELGPILYCDFIK